jgi:hypothetical protein
MTLDDMTSSSMAQPQAILDYGLLYVKHSERVYQECFFGDVATPMVDVSMVAKQSKWGNDLCLGYTSSSCHMTYNEKCMFDCKTIKSMIKLGDGKN